jgi:hypothetical protein
MNTDPNTNDYEARQAALIELLEREKQVPYSGECCADIRDGKLDAVYWYPPTPIREVKELYTFRGKRAEEKGQPIYGFEALLANLGNTGEEFVAGHMVEGDRYTFTIFTDPPVEKLFGIITIDESTEWRGRPRRLVRDFHDPNSNAARKVVVRNGELLFEDELRD